MLREALQTLAYLSMLTSTYALHVSKESPYRFMKPSQISSHLEHEPDPHNQNQKQSTNSQSMILSDSASQAMYIRNDLYDLSETNNKLSNLFDNHNNNINEYNINNNTNNDDIDSNQKTLTNSNNLNFDSNSNNNQLNENNNSNGSNNSNNSNQKIVLETSQILQSPYQIRSPLTDPTESRLQEEQLMEPSDYALQRKMSQTEELLPPLPDNQPFQKQVITSNEYPMSSQEIAQMQQYQERQRERQMQELFGFSYQQQMLKNKLQQVKQHQQQNHQQQQEQDPIPEPDSQSPNMELEDVGDDLKIVNQNDDKFVEAKKAIPRKRAPDNLMMGGQLSQGSVPQVSHQLANDLMLRTSRSQRQYDVPQIECPPAMDGMERFACPTPDRQGRYRCIDDHVLCDGFIDCPEGEDEDRQSCMFYKTTKAHLDVLADALLRWARGR